MATLTHDPACLPALAPPLVPRPDHSHLCTSVLRVPVDFLRQRVRRGRLGKRIARERAAGSELALVYSHPRTGSKSLFQALRRSDGLAALHLHAIARTHTFWRSSGPIVAEDGVACARTCRAELVRSWMRRERIRLVVPVRDPGAVNISFFLYWLKRWWAPLEWADLPRASDDRIVRLFLDRYPHFSSIRWMDLEFGAATGLSFGRDTFDRTRGATVLGNDRASALVLKTELPDAQRTRELSEFLGRPISPVRAENSSEHVLGDRSGLIARTRRVIAGIPGYVDTLLESDYARRFWTGDELEEFRRRWRAAAAD